MALDRVAYPYLTWKDLVSFITLIDKDPAGKMSAYDYSLFVQIRWIDWGWDSCEASKLQGSSWTLWEPFHPLTAIKLLWDDLKGCCWPFLVLDTVRRLLVFKFIRARVAMADLARLLNSQGPLFSMLAESWWGAGKCERFQCRSNDGGNQRASGFGVI